MGPIAMQALSEAHDTASSESRPLTRGVRCTDHIDPFQCSISAVFTNPARWPTAVHDRAELHDTSFNQASLTPGSCGVGWIDHLDPFQRSTRGMPPCGVDRDPTAMHAVRDVHDTPNKRASEPAGIATG
jgi:hypothetical protein